MDENLKRYLEGLRGKVDVTLHDLLAENSTKYRQLQLIEEAERLLAYARAKIKAAKSMTKRYEVLKFDNRDAATKYLNELDQPFVVEGFSMLSTLGYGSFCFVLSFEVDDL